MLNQSFNSPCSSAQRPPIYISNRDTSNSNHASENVLTDCRTQQTFSTVTHPNSNQISTKTVTVTKTALNGMDSSSLLFDSVPSQEESSSLLDVIDKLSYTKSKRKGCQPIVIQSVYNQLLIQDNLEKAKIISDETNESCIFKVLDPYVYSSIEGIFIKTEDANSFGLRKLKDINQMQIKELENLIHNKISSNSNLAKDLLNKENENTEFGLLDIYEPVNITLYGRHTRISKVYNLPKVFEKTKYRNGIIGCNILQRLGATIAMDRGTIYIL